MDSVIAEVQRLQEGRREASAKQAGAPAGPTAITATSVSLEPLPQGGMLLTGCLQGLAASQVLPSWRCQAQRHQHIAIYDGQVTTFRANHRAQVAWVQSRTTIAPSLSDWEPAVHAIWMPERTACSKRLEHVRWRLLESK